MSTEPSSAQPAGSIAAPPVTVKSLLASANYQKSFEKVLGERAPQFMASVANLAAMPHLKDAEPKSVLGSAFIAATLDLPVDRNMGFCHIVPYNTNVKTVEGGVTKWEKKKIAQFQMGYKGFVQLGLRTGQYASMNDAIIPAGVLTKFNPLTGELDLDWTKADHAKAPDGYAFFFKLVNGFSKTVFWTRQRVLDHAKRYSKAFNDPKSPWTTEFDAMALKTVIKFALARYGILSVQMQGALANDQAVKPDVDADAEFPDGTIDLGAEGAEEDAGKTGDGLKSVDANPPATAPSVAKPTQAEEQQRRKAINSCEGLALDLDLNLDKLMTMAGECAVELGLATISKKWADLELPVVQLLEKKLTALRTPPATSTPAGK